MAKSRATSRNPLRAKASAAPRGQAAALGAATGAARARSAAPSAATPSSPRRSTSSPRAALRRRGSTTWRSRAGVAKGTIYLYFADKEALFQELVRMDAQPVVGALEHASHADMPLPRS